jgi:dTDP-4-amino-4,6-dideoxygalactose transaminase
MKVPFLNLKRAHDEVRSEMISAFTEVYDSNYFILGDRLEHFEELFSSYIGAQHAIGVSSGLDALVLALRALEIGPGDEVLVPSNTYIASVLAVSHVGATPVFVEPDPRTYNVTSDGLAKAVTSRTKAIIPVHLYGQCCEMEGIMELARAKGLYVVEDNAQSHGASYKGKIAGSWGHINATSFYPGKNLGALGDGGGVTTDQPEHAEAIQKLRNYGSTVKYENDVLGYNCRLDEMQAAFLSIKLGSLPHWTQQRQNAAAIYSSELKDVGDLVLPYIAPHSTHVYHLYVIRSKQRDELQSYLNDSGVGTLIHYPIPPHRQNAYAHLNMEKGRLPIAEEFASTCLSLPIYPGIKEEEIAFVCDKIKAFFSRH